MKKSFSAPMLPRNERERKERTVGSDIILKLEGITIYECDSSEGGDV